LSHSLDSSTIIFSSGATPDPTLSCWIVDTAWHRIRSASPNIRSDRIAINLSRLYPPMDTVLSFSVIFHSLVTENIIICPLTDLSNFPHYICLDEG
jgi:hypothetical protein